jgi:hypothetical protein
VKSLLETTLVRISANCSSDCTCGILIIFGSIFSFMKCQSISTCFVRSCWTGLCDISIAALLSQNNTIGSPDSKPNSLISFFSQSNSHTPFIIPLNSASALDNATTACFLLLQVIIFPPTKLEYPEVDLLSVMLLVQSTFVKQDIS